MLSVLQWTFQIMYIKIAFCDLELHHFNCSISLPAVLFQFTVLNRSDKHSFCIKCACIYMYKMQTPLAQALAILDFQSNQGPVVQSVVSLTSSLRVISLTVLADSIYNILIFFCWKNVSIFCTAKATHIFSAKIWVYLRITRCKL